MASGVIESQEASGVLEIVTKSAVKKTLATPSRVRISDAHFSWGSAPCTRVPGPPTATPTENLVAFGLGVGSTRTAITTERSAW